MKDPKEPFYDAEDTASFTECTGLMPVLPKDETQNLNYAELYAIHEAAKPRSKYRRK